MNIILFIWLLLAPLFTQDCEYIIYPNPCTEYFNIKSDCEIPRIVEIYTFDGKLVLIKDIGEGQTLVRIDVNNLKSGTYIIILKDK